MPKLSPAVKKLRYDFDISYEDPSIIAKLMSLKLDDMVIHIKVVGPAGGNPNIAVVCRTDDRALVEDIIRSLGDGLMSDDDIFTVEEITS